MAAKGALKNLYKANKTYLADEVNIIKMLDDFLMNKHLTRMHKANSLFHPSRISKGIECERYWYYIFTETDVSVSMVKKEAFNARTLKILEVGNGIHWVFHSIFYEMGILEGVYKCHSCREKFWATSP